MRYIEIPETPLKLSAICLGGAMYGSAIPENESFKMMDRFFELGGNYVDTANVYADWIEGSAGASEKTIGKWLKKTGLRKSFAIGTKGGHPEIVSNPKPTNLSKVVLDEHLSRSLERLQTDYIDVYFVHRDEPSRSVAEILETMNEFITDGRVKAIGVSNFSLPRLIESREHAKKIGLTGFCANQIGWSLATLKNQELIDRERVYMDDKLLKWHQSTGFPTLAYSSQAAGFFAGKYGCPIQDTTAGYFPWVVQHYYSEENFQRFKRAKTLAKKYFCSTNDIALAYINNQTFPAIAIIGSRNVQQVEDSCKNANLVLDQKDIAYLEEGKGFLGWLKSLRPN
jgi:aryl-alcohol dehydrogenase-like predicted oxidoreductase